MLDALVLKAKLDFNKLFESHATQFKQTYLGVRLKNNEDLPHLLWLLYAFTIGLCIIEL
jgi:hypothetical protein